MVTVAAIAALVAVAAVTGVQLRRILDRLAAAESVVDELRADLDDLAAWRIPRLSERGAAAAAADRVLTDEHQRPEGGWG